MISNDKIERKKMIDRMITACEDNELTKWENDFITSVGIQFTDKGDLTDRQCEILERIYDKL